MYNDSACNENTADINIQIPQGWSSDRFSGEKSLLQLQEKKKHLVFFSWWLNPLCLNCMCLILWWKQAKNTSHCMTHHAKVWGTLPFPSLFSFLFFLSYSIWLHSDRLEVSCSFAIVFSILGNCFLCYFCCILVWKFPQFSLSVLKALAFLKMLQLRSVAPVITSVIPPFTALYLYIYIMFSVSPAFLAHLHTISNGVYVCVPFSTISQWNTYSTWSLCAVTRHSVLIPLSNRSFIFLSLLFDSSLNNSGDTGSNLKFQ